MIDSSTPSSACKLRLSLRLLVTVAARRRLVRYEVSARTTILASALRSRIWTMNAGRLPLDFVEHYICPVR